MLQKVWNFQKGVIGVRGADAHIKPSVEALDAEKLAAEYEMNVIDEAIVMGADGSFNEFFERIPYVREDSEEEEEEEE